MGNELTIAKDEQGYYLTDLSDATPKRKYSVHYNTYQKARQKLVTSHRKYLKDMEYVTEKVRDAWARCEKLHEAKVWYEDDEFNGLKMSQYLTYEDYYGMWELFEAELQQFFNSFNVVN